MLETIRKQWEAKVALLIFLAFTFFWIYIQFLDKEDILYQRFGETYGIMALWGGIWGMSVALKWGGLRSVLGKTFIMFSLGLLCQVFGQVAYSYYIYYLNVAEIPYPSIGDIGFFGTIPLYIFGSILLARASGVKVSLRNFANKIQAVLIPTVVLTTGYLLFLRNYTIDSSNLIKILLDFGYPLGQAMYISIAILTYSSTRKLLGGIMKDKVLFFLVAFAIQFLADYSFIYFQEQFYPGSVIDYMYLTSYFLMTMALLQLKTTYNKLRHHGD